MKGLNSRRCVEGDREPWGVKARVNMTLTHSVEQTFIKHIWWRLLSAPSSPPTHTFSMSMRLLCLRFPSWSNRAFSSLICSASSGFKSNSAGNAEIQYLVEGQAESSHLGQPSLPSPSPGGQGKEL